MNEKLFDYISASPTPFDAVSAAAAMLDEKGFTELFEGEDWNIKNGEGYYVIRNGSSLTAFMVPKGGFSGYSIAAAHCDSPCFKIKENADNGDRFYARLSAEKYGGSIFYTWFDRPLSIAGRVVIKTERGISARNVDLKGTQAVIPSVAIHFNRKVNEGFAPDPKSDLIPLYGLNGEASLISRVAEKLGVKEEDIVSHELSVYAAERGREWNGLISAPRLDDLMCAFAGLEAFISAAPKKSLPVLCLFDNEEVGSATKQGALSTFLADTLFRISSAAGADHFKALASSFMVSCDNAHAVHPNHPELADARHRAYMNGGVVIKRNASQKYATDAVSSALFRMICDKAGVPVQHYANRADIPGGSTLGNISSAQVSVSTVDIGLAQLAMHSAFETAGAKDTEYMTKALREFFSCSLSVSKDGWTID